MGKCIITLGVVSDTHVPDRKRTLDPRVLTLFQQRGVEAILHAGDVCVPGVLDQLGEIAPVYAVRGNRDWVFLRDLPLERRLTFGGVTIGLTHGHGRWQTYLKDKVYFLAHDGYQDERLLPRLLAGFPEAKVIVFGHSHLKLNRWIDGKLIFNPGSPHVSHQKDPANSLGFLHISEAGEVWGEIVELT